MMREALTNADLIRDPVPREGPTAGEGRYLSTFGDDGEAGAFVRFAKSFVIEWPGMLDVRLEQRGRDVFSLAPGVLAWKQSHAMLAAWHRAKFFGMSKMVTQTQEQS